MKNDKSYPVIERDNFLDTIDHVFMAGAEILIARGEPGIGKTVLLEQYARRHVEASVRIFINPLSKLAYDPQLLLSQLYDGIVELAPLPSTTHSSVVEPADVRSAYLALERRARRNKAPYYFIIDGLDDIPEEDRELRQMFIDILPLGVQAFRFLISGNGEGTIAARFKPRELIVASFSSDESHRYLSSFAPERRQSDEIHRTCRGVPGHLASVRRVLQNGTSVDELLSNFTLTVPSLFEIEWRQVDSADSRLLNCLAILAFDRNQHTVAALARICGTDEAELERKLVSLSFIHLSESRPSYLSDSVRTFAKRKLSACQQTATELVLDDLLRTPASEEALTFIPSYYEQLGRYGDLIGYLSPEHFAAVLERSHSLIVLSKRSELGMRAANDLNRDGDLTRFALQMSTGSAIARASAWKSEIEARLVVGDVVAARHIAQNALLKEVRLQLLVTIAKKLRQSGATPDTDITDEIERLYEDVDFSTLGVHAIELAADLIHVRPEMAVRLLDTLAAKGPGRSRESAWMLATLSAASDASDSSVSGAFQEAKAALHAGITDPDTQLWARAAWLFYAQYSADDMIAEAEAIHPPKLRLAILKPWLHRNAERPDACELLDYAIRTMVAATEVSPTATLLLELCAPVPFIQDPARRRYFVQLFDSHRGSAEQLGPTADYVGLCLRLARAEFGYDSAAAAHRLSDAFRFSEQHRDLPAKAICLAKVVSALEMADGTSITLKEQATNALDGVVQQLLVRAAEHNTITDEIIRALAKARSDLALELCGRLNSQQRRDEAIRTFVGAACTSTMSEPSIAIVMGAIGKIDSIYLRDRTIDDLFDAAFREKGMVLEPRIERALQGLLTSMMDQELRCRCAVVFHEYLCRSGASPDVRSANLELIRSCWDQVDSGWKQIDLGFHLVQSLATADRNAAMEWLRRTDTSRRTSGISLDANAATLAYCTRLVVRTFAGLLPKKVDSPSDIERFAGLIERIPSLATQIAVWGDIGLRMRVAGRTDDCRSIVASRVVPMLEALRVKDHYVAAETAASIFPALYGSHPAVGREWLTRMSSESADDACVRAFRATLEKRDPSDPCDRKTNSSAEVSYPLALELVELIALMQGDGVLCWAIKDIADAVSSKKNKTAMSAQQRMEVARKLESVIDAKLPNAAGIQHEGYKVVTLGYAGKIAGARRDVWQELLLRARAVPNISDRSLVFSELSECLPKEMYVERRGLLNDALELVGDVAGIEEQCSRYRTISSSALVCDELDIAKTALKKASSLANVADREDLQEERRKIIDEAYRLDPQLASSLISAMDPDPARARARRDANAEFARLERRRERAKDDGALAGGEGFDEELSLHAWELLGQMNAGRLPTLTKERARDWIRVGSKAQLDDSYPIFAYALEGLVRRFSATSEAGVTLRPLFDGLLLALELSMRICIRSSSWMPPVSQFPAPSAGSVIVRPGERGRAIEFVESWLASSRGDVLTICDAYFGPEDLEIVRLVRAIDPQCKVRILTSVKAQRDRDVHEPFEGAYRAAWRLISDDEPPETDIMLAGTAPDGMLPIHDRWWFLGEGGIRCGTSFNGFGSRESEISVLTRQETVARAQEVERFWGRVRNVGPKRMTYTLFTL